MDVNRFGRSEIETPTTLDLSDLTLLCRFEITTWRVDHFHDFPVDDQLRMKPVDDGAESELFMPWRADLAHQKKVQRRPEMLSHLKSDWDATAW